MLPANDAPERPQAASSPRLPLFLVSGGTGRTCEQLVRAALAQFDGASVELVRRWRIWIPEEGRAVVEEAARAGAAALFHTLVVPEVHQAVVETCERLGIRAVDLLGPALAALGDCLPGPRRNRPGLFYEIEHERFDRIDAVDFALAHDHGARLAELDEADVVLVGVSRVSKSVTSFYLACRGIRAANVTLVPGRPVPPELAALDPRKVVGLTMSPELLRSLRAPRMAIAWPGSAQDYTDPKKIAAEVREAASLMQRFHWRSIDVSHVAIEEVASEIAARMTHD